MNLFFKSYNFYIFFFLICAMEAPLLLGQAVQKEYNLIPETANYNLPARYNQTSNTSFTKNNKGVIFIGKQNGILAIDGDELFFKPSKSPVYLCNTKYDKVIYLTKSDFGMLDYNYQQGLTQVSQIDKIPGTFQDFYPINMTSFEAKTFLATSAGVITIGARNIDHFYFNRNSDQLFNSGKNLFLLMKTGDLYLWNGGAFNAALTSVDLNNGKVTSLTDWEDGVIIFTDLGRQYFFKPETGIRSLKRLPGNMFRGYDLVKKLDDDHYIAKNNTNLVGLFSKNEGFITPLSGSDNLPGSVLKSVFIDNFDDIWLLYDFNLFKLEYPSRSYILDLSDLISNTILSTALLGESVYFGTNDGIFRLAPKESGRWVTDKIPTNENAYFNTLSSNGKDVFAAGNKGLYMVSGKSAIKLLDGMFTFSCPLDSSSIIAVNNAGLFIIRKSGKKWEHFLLDNSIIQICSYTIYNNEIWLLSGDNILYFVDKGGKLHKNTEKLAISGDCRLLVLDDVLHLLDQPMAYKYEPHEKRFYKLKLNSETDQLLNSELIVETPFHQWNVENLEGINSIWTFDEDHLNIPFYEFTAGKNFGPVTDIDENSEFIWISGNKKFLRINQKVEKNSDTDKLKMQSVTLLYPQKDKEISFLSDSQKINYGRRQYNFNFTDLKYQNNPFPYYRYKLTHYQENWSVWQRSNTVIMNNLKERDYSFEVQSVTQLGVLSDPLYFQFTIKPPIYRSWFAYILYFIILLSVSFLIYKWRLLRLKHVEFRLEERIRERMATVLSEKEKSDKLVADLFPKGTAEELISKGRAASQKFDLVTVLFSDIQGFTKIAEEMNPDVLIDELDKFFFHFDSVADKYNIEKIKTIGDAYMAAGGIPVKNSSNPVEVVLAGIEMQYYMNDLKRKKTDIWDLRIGIHTGPVITGVVGHKKLSYDIWGDTVNTASRMESSGEAGKVNISGMTYSYVKDFFICEYRGKLPVKYKGNIDMYFVTGLRPELSVDLKGIPNRRFFIKLKLIRLHDIEERIFEDVLSNQSLEFHFHKNDYLHRVLNQTELLGRSENISDDELVLTQTAAILLYAGLSETYTNYEIKSAEITKSLLPEYDYDEREIDRINNLILATKEPFNPQNNLEAILIDAKMEYLGRSDYLTQVKLLYLEEKNLIKDLSKEKFIKRQIERLENFEYFTLAAQRLREISKEEQISKLKSWE